MSRFSRDFIYRRKPDKLALKLLEGSMLFFPYAWERTESGATNAELGVEITSHPQWPLFSFRVQIGDYRFGSFQGHYPYLMSELLFHLTWRYTLRKKMVRLPMKETRLFLHMPPGSRLEPGEHLKRNWNKQRKSISQN